MVMFIKKITLLLVTNFCLETCSVVDTECTKQKQPKERRAYFGQQFRSKAHHHGEFLAPGAYDRWSYHICTHQEAGNDECGVYISLSILCSPESP